MHSVLDRDELLASPLADLHALANELGLDSYRLLRRERLVDSILAGRVIAAEAEQNGNRRAAGPSSRSAAAGEERRPARRRRSGRGELVSVAGGEAADAEAISEPGDAARRDVAPGAGGAGEPELVEGVVAPRSGGGAMLRVNPPEPSDDDVYISPAQVKRCELLDGDRVSGPLRRRRRSERHRALLRIETINGVPADEAVKHPPAGGRTAGEKEAQAGAGRAGRGERSAAVDRTAGAGRAGAGRGGRAERLRDVDGAEHNGAAERSERPARGGRGARGDRPARGDREARDGGERSSRVGSGAAEQSGAGAGRGAGRADRPAAGGGRSRSRRSAAQGASGPAFPAERIALDGDGLLAEITALAPLGYGSRAVICGPARSGKSELLRRILDALAGDEQVDLQLLLIGIRPEELSGWRGAQVKPVAERTFADEAESCAADLREALERAERSVAASRRAVLLVDTLDALPAAEARRALASARNERGAGSLTIIATAQQPLGGETTVLALAAGAAGPGLDVAASGTLKVEEMLGAAGAAALERARAAKLRRKRGLLGFLRKG